MATTNTTWRGSKRNRSLQRQPAIAAYLIDQQTCENCGRIHATVTARPHGYRECATCYRASLAHGERHGVASDGSEL